MKTYEQAINFYQDVIAEFLSEKDRLSWNDLDVEATRVRTIILAINHLYEVDIHKVIEDLKADVLYAYM